MYIITLLSKFRPRSLKKKKKKKILIEGNYLIPDPARFLNLGLDCPSN